ncbi:conjugal transfer protein [Vibrio sp. SS-MA-C1-2]|uniref:conjugal transfer protein n=1 Tax=Vibrio sp. SS-MA-C1-2 TaxID=2908646 RepID=UPI001F1D0BF6|nr:conjugal transfer protein [Vibrio sp. SS-MA-C1-2]UJF17258.1 conjugal transfer protein [Vibrio sp. SS-MA-C1-2]
MQLFNKIIQKSNLAFYFVLSSFLLLISSPARSAGGLAEATSALQTFQTWLYGFLGVGVLVYMIYQIIMAMLEKQTWGDVFTSVGKVAAAGGCVALATWAWGIWGS